MPPGISSNISPTPLRGTTRNHLALTLLAAPGLSQSEKEVELSEGSAVVPRLAATVQVVTGRLTIGRRRRVGQHSHTTHLSRQRLICATAKPAPLGLIGVCALDVKARSKPSRNILNRLLANREFDVKIFGDKVILDEGKGVAYPFRSHLLMPCHQISRTGPCGT